MRTFRDYCRQAQSFAYDRETFETYKDWRVTSFARHRDSECWQESNFHVALRELGGETTDRVAVLRFGHWAVGWVEHILVAPSTWQSGKAAELAEREANYPILDEHDFCEREQEAADLTWKNCYSSAERIRYIREHRSQFEPRSFAELLGCVRGNYFLGYASEMAVP